MKCKIEKNTVQETLILPLYSRKLCTELYPNLYRDETAVRLLDQIDYDFSVAEKNSGSLMPALWCAGGGTCSSASCLGGAGLSERPPLTRRWSIWAAGWTTPAEPATTVDAGSTIWTSRMLLPCGSSYCPPGSGYKTSPATLKDTAWFSQIDASRGGGVLCLRRVLLLF